MIERLGVKADDRVLDVAAGTGSITRLLQVHGANVVSLDQSSAMLRIAVARGATGVVAAGEHLPFSDEAFDAVTFGYLLRYVDNVERALAELVRVVRPGGAVGMVEFGRPRGMAGSMWNLYTRFVLPAAGKLIAPGWRDVGTFLGPSIEEFAHRWPLNRLVEAWQAVGLADTRIREMSLGGGLVMTARKA